jgi:hypothetical protein
MTSLAAEHGEPQPDLHGFAMGGDDMHNVYGDHLAMFHHPSHRFQVIVRFDFSERDQEDRVIVWVWATSKPAVLINHPEDEKLLDQLIRGPYVAYGADVPDSDLAQLTPVAYLERVCLRKAAVILHERTFEPNQPTPNFQRPEFLLYGTKNPTRKSSSLLLSHYMTVADDYQQMFLVLVPNSVIPDGIDTTPALLAVDAPNGTAEGSGLLARQEVSATVAGGAPITMTISQQLWHDTAHYRDRHHLSDAHPLATLLGSTAG